MVILILVVMNSIIAFAADDTECLKSPNGKHCYDAHRYTGAGYSEDYGTHIHRILYIGDTEIIYSCDRTANYSYCQYQCIYCNALTSNYHTHKTIYHSYDGSRESVY